eukprot:tig00000237_g20493.t1
MTAMGAIKQLYQGACAITGLGLTVFGVFSVLSVVTNINVLDFILSLYIIPAGILIFVSELKFSKLDWTLKYLPFLKRSFGRAATILFFGSLALGLLRPWGYLVGAIAIALGLLGIFVVKVDDDAAAFAQAPPQQAAPGLFSGAQQPGAKF